MNRRVGKLIKIGKFDFDSLREVLLRDGARIDLSQPAVQMLSVVAARERREVPLAELKSLTGLSDEQMTVAMHELSGILDESLTIDDDNNAIRLAPDQSLYGFLEELRERKVFRVATGYAVFAWLLLQVGEIVFPLIGLGEPAMRVLLIGIVIGFPVAVSAAWALELTPGGLVLDFSRTRPRRSSGLDERKLNRFIIATLMIVIALLVFRLWFDRSGEPADVRVVAIVPFENSNAEQGDSSLCEGFAEEIRVGLDRLPGIRVSARDIVVALGPAAREMDIGWLVEGRCRVVKDFLDVKVSLTDVSSGLQHWAYSDSRRLDQLLTFQEDIAATLAFQLAVPGEAMEATNDAKTSNPRAYRSYLQARGYLSRPNQFDSLATAANLFSNALDEDNQFAAAHAGLCEANLARYLRNHDTVLEREAESACFRASQLGPGLPEVHLAMGRLFLETGDHVAAERALRQALELKPGSVSATTQLANVLAAQNLPAQAEALHREAIAVPAGSWLAHNGYGRFLLKRGRLEDAAIQFEEVVSLTPDNAPAFNNLGATYLQLGRLEEAGDNFERAVAIEPVASSISNYGTMLYYTGRFAEAETQFRRAAEMSPFDHRFRGNIADAVRHINGRESDAVIEYKHATELVLRRLDVSQKDSQAAAAHAWYRACTGDIGEATELIEQALQDAPSDPEVIYYAALISIRKGDHGAAPALLDAAVAAGYPDFLLEASPDL